MKAHIPLTNRPRVLIVGGGFGGIRLAQSLRKQPFQVVMIDKNNFHTFQPLLYQVATGGLEADSIAFPLRKIFAKQDNFVFRMAELERVDVDKNTAFTSIGEISFDYLVMATGSQSSFFGMKGVEENAFGMKTVAEALDLRHLILQNFEDALQEDDANARQRLMQFVVVGGGPTGVETAGALAELKRYVLPNDYPELDLRQMEVHLIEAGDELLGGMSEQSSKQALKSLQKLGVHVWFNTFVQDFDGDYIKTSTGKIFETSLVLWAAGIEGSVVDGLPEEAIERSKRIQVDEFNRIPGLEHVFALGDVAYMPTEKYPKGHPQVAPVAVQQATYIARNLRKMQKNQPLVPFKYKDKGSMATIGRNKAVVDLGNFHMRGFWAWMVWMGLHLVLLMGFRNKLVVFINWVWSYLTYDKGTRLIIRPNREKVRI